MAIGVASDFQIYDNQYFAGLIETMAQATDALMSVGIQLSTRQIPGDFERQSLIQAISGIVSRRDTTSTSGVTDLAVPWDESVSVKFSRKIGPVATTLDAWRKAGLPFVAEWDPTGMQGLSRYLGAQSAKATQVEILNTALLAVRTFLENANSGSNLHTIADNGTMTTPALTAALALMGDASANVAAFVMHSKPYFDLVNYQVDPTNGGSDLAFGVVQSAVPQSLNRPVYVTDSASLVVAGTPNLYRTIGLVPGGIALTDSEERTLVSDVVTGLENLVGRMQGEFSYSLGVKGAKWDSANGGANPNSTAVGTATNWDQIATDMKDAAGVVIISG